MIDRITIQDTICEVIADQMGWDEEERKTTHHTNSFEYLGADRLDIVEIIMELEIKFGIDFNEDEMDDNFHMKTTVGEMTQLIEKKLGI